jgi:hypothetical protein
MSKVVGCEVETPHARQRLFGEVTYWSEISYLASDGLDKDL